jgi:hypothetical protein
VKGIRFDERDTRVELQGLETFLKTLKMKPVLARIGILGSHNTRREQSRLARSFAKTVGAVGRWKASKQVLKEKVKAGRFGAGNATVGAAHEFGSLMTGLPKRSFLREPLINHLQKELDKKGAFSQAEQAEILKEKSLVPWTKKVGVIAEEVVKAAFDTNGYGTWAPVTAATAARKTTKDTLVETTQLRDSIISDVRAVK